MSQEWKATGGGRKEKWADGGGGEWKNLQREEKLVYQNDKEQRAGKIQVVC